MKETIKASYTDTITFNRYKQEWLVNNQSYSSSKYKIKIVKRPLPDKNKHLKEETKQLYNFTNLKKKIQILNKQLRQYETATLQKDKDTIYLKGKAIKKTRCIISKYLYQLKQDTNFTIKKVGETCFNMGYKGEYITATHQGNIIAEGVF